MSDIKEQIQAIRDKAKQDIAALKAEEAGANWKDYIGAKFTHGDSVFTISAIEFDDNGEALFRGKLREEVLYRASTVVKGWERK